MARNLRLVEMRKKAGLTQSQVARLAGVTQSMIARLEAGQRDARKITKIRLAKLFGVTVEWLFYEQYEDIETKTSAGSD